MKEIVKSDAALLRQKAESKLESNPLKSGLPLSEIDALRLIHELQVHQIELEMQNEELSLAKEQAELASQKYTELYDFAPSGYFTLSTEGKILELNLSGALMLGNARLKLMNNSFGIFVSHETRPIFNLFLRNIFNNRTRETCEITLCANSNPPMYVYLSGTCTENEDQCIVNATDISSRKLAEEAFKESENRKHAITLETAMDGYCLLDGQGCFLEVNESYCRMTGYSKHEMLTKRIHDFEVKESPDETASHIQKIIELGEDRFESLHRRKDGSIFEIESSVQYRQENGGQFVVFLHDISERKQAEESLREKDEFLNKAEEIGHLGSWSLDLIHNKLRWSDEIYRIFGLLPQEFAATYEGFLEAVHPADRKAVNDAYTNSIFEGKDSYEIEHRIVRKHSGELRYVSEKCEHIRDASGKIVGSVGVVHDITEQKQAELDLRESEEMVRHKLKSILSPEGNITDLELNDIIDTPSIQKLMDHFYELTQIPMAIIDVSGKVLVSVGWQDICTKFHRVNPLSCANCIESDVYLTQGIPDGEFRIYKCKNNMLDMATPLMIGGEHKGNLFMGQIFFDDEPLDYNLFRKQANQYAFDELEYMVSLEKVPRLSHQKFDHAKAFFLNLSRSISQLSYSNIKLARAITQQKQSEEAIRISEKRFRDLVSNIPIGVILFGSNSEVILSNPKAMELLGVNESQVTDNYTTSDWDTIREDGTQFPKSERPVPQTFATRQPVKDVVIGVYRPATSDYIWLLINTVIVLQEDGTIQNVIGTFIDITQQKKAENELKASEEKFSIIYKKSPYAISISNFSNGRIEDVNEAF